MVWYDMIWYGMIRYDIFVNCNKVDKLAEVQYTFTHKQYTEQHNETEYLERNVYNGKNT